nr:hypothetical protein [Tanacetum cinerariifolium]
MFYDNDEHSREYLEKLSKAITLIIPTEEPEYSLRLGDEHSSTISEKESDELIKSSVENLVPIPRESEEFSGELMPTSIINEERIKREHEEYISLIEKLLTINSFPHLLENFHANTIIETLPTSPIPVEDSDSLREEIDIFTDTDDLMPLGIESDDYDSKGDIYFLKELLSNDFIPLPENKSSNFDHYDDPSFPRLPPKPPDVEGEVRLMFLQILKMTITFPSYLSFEFFYRNSLTLRFLLYFSPPGVKTPVLTTASPFRAGGISLGWNFHVL